MPDQQSTDPSPSDFRLYPNPFEKRDRPRVAAIGVFPYRDFREADKVAIERFCCKAPILVAFQHLVDRFGMRLCGIVRP